MSENVDPFQKFLFMPSDIGQFITYGVVHLFYFFSLSLKLCDNVQIQKVII